MMSSTAAFISPTNTKKKQKQFVNLQTSPKWRRSSIVLTAPSRQYRISTGGISLAIYWGGIKKYVSFVFIRMPLELSDHPSDHPSIQSRVHVSKELICRLYEDPHIIATVPKSINLLNLWINVAENVKGFQSHWSTLTATISMMMRIP